MRVLVIIIFLLLPSGFSHSRGDSDVLDYLFSSYQALDVKYRRPTLGIELEGVFPGKSREEAFQKIETIFLDQFSRFSPKLERFTFFTRNTNQRREGSQFTLLKSGNTKWQVKDDGSIIAPKGYVGVELVSPILRTANDVAKYKRLVEKYVEAGLKSEPNSAALQMHFGFPEDLPLDKNTVSNESKAKVLLLILIFSKIERQLMEIYKVTEGRKKYTVPTPIGAINEIKSGMILSDLNLHSFINKHYKYRYWALNPHSLFTFGTAEIRFMNSTTDSVAVDELSELANALWHSIQSKDSNLISILKRFADTEEIPLELFAREMKLNKLIHKLKSGNNQCAQVLSGAQAS